MFWRSGSGICEAHTTFNGITKVLKPVEDVMSGLGHFGRAVNFGDGIKELGALVRKEAIRITVAR